MSVPKSIFFGTGDVPELTKVVRCRNCKWWSKQGEDEVVGIEGGYCYCSQWENENYETETCGDDFCSYAIRKGGEDDG